MPLIAQYALGERGVGKILSSEDVDSLRRWINNVAKNQTENPTYKVSILFTEHWLLIQLKETYGMFITLQCKTLNIFFSQRPLSCIQIVHVLGTFWFRLFNKLYVNHGRSCFMIMSAARYSIVVDAIITLRHFYTNSTFLWSRYDICFNMKCVLIRFYNH